MATDGENSHGSDVRVDPMIFEKQKDWEDIYDSDVILKDPSLEHVDINFNEVLHLGQVKNLPMAKKGMLAYIWFGAAVDGSHIFYPQNERELKLYAFKKSALYNAFVELCIFIIFLSPIIINEECFANNTTSSRRKTNTVLGVFVLLATLAQLGDVVLFSYTKHWNDKYQLTNTVKSDQLLTWHILRSIVSFILVLNSIIYLGRFV